MEDPMPNNEIDNYIQKILKKQLQKLKLSNYGLYSILKDVKIKLTSLIKHWNEPQFIQSLFITAIEEGHFYEPHINDNISCLIVLGVRNTLLEIAASINYKEYGLTKPLSNDNIKEITMTAINYFKDINLEELSNNLTIENDYYGEVSLKYPHAYMALQNLGSLTQQTLELEYKDTIKDKYIPQEILDNTENNTSIKEYASGITNTITPALASILKAALNKEIPFFYVDAFKILSRNYEIILQVLEFTITNDIVFVTNNFYIQNGYVSRRKDLIRAGHNGIFNKNAFNTLSQISNKYSQELEKLTVSTQ